MRPLLLGMNNPLSDDPEYDLYPYPEGSAGWRLWKMMPDGTTRAEYLRMFDRRNLLRAREWSQAKARLAAEALLPELDGRFVVVLGSEVRAALCLPPAEPLSVHLCNKFVWLAMPHPSGRNRWFNDPDNYRRAREVLAAVARGALSEVAA